MVDVPMQRALPSDELPMPTATAHDAGQVRQQATVGTIAVPEYREVEVDGRTVLLTRLTSGEIIAFDGYCPHQGTSLRRATIFGGLVRCEQHKFVYDPQTGRNVLPTRDATPKALDRLQPGYLPTYAVEEREGWVWVGARPNPPPTGDEPLPEAPISGARPVAPPAAEERPGARPPETVDVAVGETFDLDLPTQYRPNHLWRVAVEGEAVEVRGQTMDQDADGTRYVVAGLARAAGTATVHCDYAKPWDTDVWESRTFIVRVSSP